jgi:hypothetical protein
MLLLLLLVHVVCLPGLLPGCSSPTAKSVLGMPIACQLPAAPKTSGAHLRQRLYTSASMHLNRWKPTLKGMCVTTAVVRAANGTSAAAEGKVATVTHTNIAKLTTPPATIVCRQTGVQEQQVCVRR